MSTFLLIYDIPTGSGSPCAALRRYGARINLSCWLIEGVVLDAAIGAVQQCDGAKFESIAFADRERERVRGLAQRGLEAEAGRIRGILGGIESAVQRAIDRETRAGAHPVEARGAGRRCALAALRSARRDLASLGEASLLFDLGGDLASLVSGVQSAIRAGVVVWSTFAPDGQAEIGGLLEPSEVTSE